MVESFYNSLKGRTVSPFRVFVFQLNPFWIQLVYFTTLSFLGYLVLKFTKPMTSMPKDLDLFFTSVSAATVSSMTSVQMETFSNTQFLILTILMFTGGEVFTSLLGLLFTNPDSNTDDNLKCKSIKFLTYVVLCYLLLVHVIGYVLVLMYISLIPSAKAILESKNMSVQIFLVSIVVSSFSNCGFVRINESMLVFKKNSGFLLLLIPQILIGNTLYAPCLRFIIWLLEKFTKQREFSYILENCREFGYDHLLSGMYCKFLALTVMGFSLLQFVLFCSLEWNSEALSGLSSYEKSVASLFQVLNSRGTGLSVSDLCAIAPAILALFVVMMYLPPYTTFLRAGHREIEATDEKTKRKNVVDNLMFSQLSYIVIVIIIICIIERRSLKEDPLNFNVLNITIEVVSAYGNVGFSTGYSCGRRLKPESSCVDTYAGLVGRWSDEGKILLILVMCFGRLKRYTRNGGKAWILY